MAATNENKAQGDTETQPEGDQNPPIIVDFGRKSSKKIKQLKRGEGCLSYDISATLDQLRADGEIGDDVQVVIAVVEKKPKEPKMGPFWN